ncbi:Glutamate racemase [hydrothermal vent metagenome]|uniref:glutamate racemase n=1 Tax=hydrothermal vent metagenome TaxID=652676 RepID=A0A3B1E334_9ZZZZ
MPKDNKVQPIGIFDSGLGGLTVVKALMKHLPGEAIIYYGDTARVPYGTKSKEAIIRFSCENAEILLRHKVKMIVVACNSSSSYAIKVLQKKFDIPICGVIEPGAQDAVQLSHNGRIGVIATLATTQSQAYTKAIYHYNKKIKVFEQACPLFVPLVEEGWFNKKVAITVAQEYLSLLKKRNVDTVILGCTHYPLLKTTIQKVMGSKVILVDSADVVAKKVSEVLASRGLRYEGCRNGRHSFFVSDRPQAFEKIAKRFLGQEIKSKVIH